MKNVLALLCCIVIIASFSVSAETTYGYGKTKWGMTPEQVLSAEDGRAHKLTPPIKYANSWAFVGIDKIKIGSADFKVVYQFVDNRLNQVLLQTIEDKNGGINRDTFQRVEQLLTQKYGEPRFKEAGKSIVWKVPGTTIELSHLFIEDVVSLVSIHYSSDSESNKMTENL